VHVRLGSEGRTRLNRVSWRDNNLRGWFNGTIPTSDARRWRHNVVLNLRLRNGTLSGMATAQNQGEPVLFGLTSFASLVKKAGDLGTR
jgi:hypothetical protein